MRCPLFTIPQHDCMITFDLFCFIFSFIGIDPRILPTVISSAQVYGHVRDSNCRLAGVNMGGILGDQQAALVGQTWDPNPDPEKPRPHVKVTYGTGAFLLWDIGDAPSFSPYGLLTTIAYQMGPNAQVHYALEVSVFFVQHWVPKDSI